MIEALWLDFSLCFSFLRFTFMYSIDLNHEIKSKLMTYPLSSHCLLPIYMLIYSARV